MDITKAQLGEPMGLIGITYRSLGEGLLIGVEITQNSFINTAYPSMGESSQTWELGVYYTVCRQLNRLESVLSRCHIGVNLF